MSLPVGLSILSRPFFQRLGLCLEKMFQKFSYYFSLKPSQKFKFSLVVVGIYLFENLRKVAKEERIVCRLDAHTFEGSVGVPYLSIEIERILFLVNAMVQEERPNV